MWARTQAEPSASELPAGYAHDFYKDQDNSFMVGQAAGGAYDTYTRTVARHMIKHTPGHPAITVEDMTWSRKFGGGELHST